MPKPRVVIVEDAPEIVQLLHDLLETEGLPSIGVGDPAFVLPVARRNQPALFLIDVMLPTVSGIEVAQQLRGNGFVQTPMIAMSASAYMLRVASDSGLFQAVVAKPFDFDVLFDWLARLLVAGDETG